MISVQAEATRIRSIGLKLNEPSRGFAFEHLLKQKLGTLFDWKMPNVAETVGPHDVSVFEEFDAKRSALAQRVQGYLAELSDNAIDKLADPDTLHSDEVKSSWLEYERDAIHQMQKYSPPWYAGGFGH